MTGVKRVAPGARLAERPRRRVRPLGFALVLMLLLCSGNVLAEESAGFTPPEDSERCPVCGMFVAPYATWIAEVVLVDQPPLYFDGPKDLFNYLLTRASYPPSSQPELAAVFVTEYYTQQHLPAEAVYFVAGSDVLGPMGKELVPIEGEEALTSFLLDHGGERVMRYEDQQLKEVPKP